MPVEPLFVISTPRLSLIVAAPDLVLTLIEAPERFAEVAGAAAAAGLREFYTSGEVSTEWLSSLRASAAADPWRHGFFVIDTDAGLVIGGAGFKGPADAEGVAEMAYGIVPAFEGRGLATESAAALVAFAGADPSVRRLRAHTKLDNAASQRVLEKRGFAYLGTVIDPDDGLVMRWERDARDTDEAPAVFVYGTLRRDSGHPMHDVLAGGSTYLGPAAVHGRMFDLGAYPGIIPSVDEQDVVAGELYELHADAGELLRVLDDYEGVGRRGDPPGEYVRRPIEVWLTDGRRRVAWAWVLTEPWSAERRRVE